MAVRPPQADPEAKPSRRPPWWLIGIVVLGVALIGYQWYARSSSTDTTPLSEVATEIKAGQVERIAVSGDSLTVKLKDGTEQSSNREPDASLTESLANLGVSPEALAAIAIVSDPPSGISFTSLLFLLLPLLLIGSLFI